MATVTLRPNATISIGDWTLVGGGGTAHATLSDENNSTYLRTGKEQTFEVELEALDSVGLNIGTIDSIQVVMTADNSVRSQSTGLTCSYRDSSSNLINSYTQTITITTSGGTPSTDNNWTSRTTSDGSTAWSDSDIDGMRLRVVCGPSPGVGNIQVSELYLVVTYTEAVIVIPKSLTINGTLTLNGGQLIIK